jgi:hypothetical protein
LEGAAIGAQNHQAKTRKGSIRRERGGQDRAQQGVQESGLKITRPGEEGRERRER